MKPHVSNHDHYLRVRMLRARSQSFSPGKLLPAFLILWIVVQPGVHGQQSNGSSVVTNRAADMSKEAQFAALELERTNAWQQVSAIVNRPVAAYARNPQIKVSISSPGWFHKGAAKPDFNNADVRQTQDLSYAKNKYVSSDLNPNMMFLGQDLEFNSATKYFYLNHSLPKRKLSEAEMLQINDLYRIIGRCEREMRRLQPPAVVDVDETTDLESTTDSADVAPQLNSIRSIPKETRLLYGGIGIGVLLVVVLGLRVMKKKRGSKFS